MKSILPSWPKLIAALVVLAAVFVLGYLTGDDSADGASGEGGSGAAAGMHEHEEKAPEVWTCAMHPQIRQPKAGLCPLCAMDLIPVKSDPAGGRKPRELTLDARARKLAAIRTAPAQRRFAPHEVRMIGKVAYDETRVGRITAWVPGRIDRLFANYTGVPVGKGEHMVELYSPQLVTAQTELLQALAATADPAGSAGGLMQERAQATVESVRDRLRLWGLTEEQIAQIEERGTPADHLTVYAPMGGIVVEKNAIEGAWVEKGSPIYTVADLSKVWVRLEAYESDLAWLRYSQEVHFEVEAFPGESFSGKIAFIDPVLNERTRTVGVRVNVPNEEGRLRPGMFVRARVSARMAEGGAILDVDLAGKWISPMHPEIVKDGPGFCDVCGMPLVTAESLGYAAEGSAESDAPLVIPASAPLITGKRAVVYVATPGREGVFEGREVVLGPRAGDDYVVREGLSEGDEVVVNGAFKIDSAVQILAGTSMMSPAEGPDPSAGAGAFAGGEHAEEITVTRYETPATFRRTLDTVFSAYFDGQTGLSTDSLEVAKKSAASLLEALAQVDAGLLEGDALHFWKKDFAALEESAGKVRDAGEINSAREAFSLLSESLIVVTRRFGGGGGDVFFYHCPMAFDWRGANWLQNREGVENPYFGAAMYRCGELKETFSDGPRAVGEKVDGINAVDEEAGGEDAAGEEAAGEEAADKKAALGEGSEDE
jgi:membrane fusion protein, copper/silver efflux system